MCSFQYKNANVFLDDFELMKKNAIKFNSAQHPIAQEAVAIYDFVKSQIEASRQEFTQLEEAVTDMFNGKPKRKKAKKDESTSGVEAANIYNIDGVAVNLGDLQSDDDDDDDSN